MRRLTENVWGRCLQACIPHITVLLWRCGLLQQPKGKAKGTAKAAPNAKGKAKAEHKVQAKGKAAATAKAANAAIKRPAGK